MFPALHSAIKSVLDLFDELKHEPKKEALEPDRDQQGDPHESGQTVAYSFYIEPHLGKD